MHCSVLSFMNKYEIFISDLEFNFILQIFHDFWTFALPTGYLK